MSEKQGEEAVARATGALALRSVRALLVVTVVYVALVATHGGEFWPFSSYPMFARAGRPWQRALVRVVDEPTLLAARSRTYTLQALPGRPLPLGRHGVPQNDLSSLLQRAEGWGPAEATALARLFGSLPCQAPLVVLRVSGSLEAGAVQVVATPIAALGCEGGVLRVEALAGRGA